MRKYEYDSWNKVENGQIMLSLYHQNKERIGYVCFRTSGQIGLIDVATNYRRQGIGTIMLQTVEKELTCNKLWAICTKEHYFWSTQKGYTYEIRPNKSVNGSGYSKSIHD